MGAPREDAPDPRNRTPKRRFISRPIDEKSCHGGRREDGSNLQTPSRAGGTAKREEGASAGGDYWSSIARAPVTSGGDGSKVDGGGSGYGDGRKKPIVRTRAVPTRKRSSESEGEIDGAGCQDHYSDSVQRDADTRCSIGLREKERVRFGGVSKDLGSSRVDESAASETVDLAQQRRASGFTATSATPGEARLSGRNATTWEDSATERIENKEHENGTRDWEGHSRGANGRLSPVREGLHDFGAEEAKEKKNGVEETKGERGVKDREEDGKDVKEQAPQKQEQSGREEEKVEAGVCEGRSRFSGFSTEELGVDSKGFSVEFGNTGIWEHVQGEGGGRVLVLHGASRMLKTRRFTTEVALRRNLSHPSLLVINSVRVQLLQRFRCGVCFHGFLFTVAPAVPIQFA